MGDSQGCGLYRNDISGRLCAGGVDNLGTGSYTLKADYSSGLDNTINIGCQGTSATLSRSNLVYTGSSALDNIVAVGCRDCGGIRLDDYIEELAENLLCSGQQKGRNEDVDGEVTVPPMRGFIEI